MCLEALFCMPGPAPPPMPMPCDIVPMPMPSAEAQSENARKAIQAECDNVTGKRAFDRLKAEEWSEVKQKVPNAECVHGWATLGEKHAEKNVKMEDRECKARLVAGGNRVFDAYG